MTCEIHGCALIVSPVNGMEFCLVCETEGTLL